MASRKLTVEIVGDTRGLSRALGQASRSTSSFASNARKAFSIGGVAAAGGLGFAIKSAMGFEKQLDSLGAVADATGKQMEALRKQALKAGADTAFSAREAAQAQTELAKGGVSAGKILSGGLNAALSLAAAGELELAEAAEVTANSLNLFGLRGDEAARVADAMATAANATTADVSDFGMAMKQAGSVAKMAGFDFTETMVGLEALAAAGIKNSDAGTSMKAALLQLLGPSEKQKNLQDKLNLSFVDSNGKMKSLADISEMLRKRLGGMGEAQRTANLKVLAGSDGVRFISSLYQAGAPKLKKYEEGLREQGTAAEVAAKKQDNLAGRLEQLKGSAETLGITVGTALIPALTDGAEAATNFINGMMNGTGAGGQFVSVVRDASNTIRGFVTSTEGLAAVGAIVGGLAGRFVGLQAALVIGKITAFVSGIKAAGGAMAALSTAIRANPIGILATVIGAAAGAFGLLSLRQRENSTTARDVAESQRAVTDALRAQEDAIRAVRDLDIDLAQRHANLKSATVAVEQAEKRLKDLRKSGTASALDIKQAEADLKQARVSQKRAQRDLNDVEEDSKRKREAAREATSKLSEEQRKATQTQYKHRDSLRAEIVEKEKDIRKAESSAKAYQAVGAKVQGAGDKAQAARAKASQLREELAKLKSKELTVSVRLDFNTAINASPGSDRAQGDGWGAALKNRVTAGVKANASSLFMSSVGGSAAGAVGGLKGARPQLGPFAALGARFGLGVSSGARPGSITSSGNQSWHSTGEAIDVAGSADGMLAYARVMAQMFGGRLAELIYTPLGFSIKNGARVAPYAQADHMDHVHVAMDVGAPGQGDGWGRRGGRKAKQGDGWGISARQRRIIIAAARKAGIDPAILYGLYGAESNFGRNKNRSSAGAVGPFQFLPSTAASMGVDPFNFKSAAFGAARYLGRYKNRGTAGMLAAYNAGPAGNPNNPETQAYIPKVLAFAKQFNGPKGLGGTIEQGKKATKIVGEFGKAITGLGGKGVSSKRFAAIGELRTQMKDLATEAAAAWRKIRESELEAARDSQLSAIGNSAEAVELRGLQAAAAAEQEAEEYQSLQDTKTEADKAVTDAAAQLAQDGSAKYKSEWKLAYDDARKAQAAAQDAIEDHARDKRIEGLSNHIAVEEAKANSAYDNAVAALDAEEAAMEVSMQNRLGILLNGLQQQKIGYVQWAKEVSAILAPLGLGFDVPAAVSNPLTAGPSKKLIGKLVGTNIGVGAGFLPARAHGGPVTAGGAYIVGERGPELLQMGSRSGNVVPNHKMGGTTIVQKFYGPIGSSRQARVMADRLAYRISFG